MPASLHVVSYTAPDAARMLARMRNLRRDFGSCPGMVAGRLFSTWRATQQVGFVPTPRRWALLCAFDDGEAQSEFECSRLCGAFAEDGRERWRVTFQPTKIVEGSWYGWHPTADEAEPLRPDEPVAVMTYGLLRPRHSAWFMKHNRRIVAELVKQEGLITSFGMSDTARTTSTVSIWRGQRDIARFAYGSGTAHKPVVRPSLDLPSHENFFFARFRLTDAEGTLAGRDPIAA